MRRNKPLLAVLAALVTALTTAGGIFVTFLLMIDVLDLPATVSQTPIRALLFLLLLPLPFISGGLWGTGIAFLLQRPVWQVAKKMAWTWGGIQIVVTLVLDITQVPIFASLAVLGKIPHILHYLFTLVFVPAIGIVVLLNTRKLLEVLGMDDFKIIVGLRSGAAAAGAFLLASLALLIGPGWEVAGPLAGQNYSMITIMHVCNFAAALAGGLVLGWMVADKSAQCSFTNVSVVEPHFSTET